MKTLWSLRCCFLAASFAAFPIYSDQLSDLEAYIQKVYEISEVPGAAVAIVKDEKIIFSKGYGVCRLGQDDKVNQETIFQLASVSKTFAAAGLAVLVDQKKLAWDKEVVNYLQSFVLDDIYASRFATSRDLLSHRTGLPAFQGDLLGSLGYTPEDVLFRIRFLPPAVSFRMKGLYSNVNFFLAGKLLEAISKGSWLKAIQTSLLTPLEMHRTGGVDNLKNGNTAFPHAKIDGSIRVIPRDASEIFVAAGGVSSSASDMANWMIMHLNKGRYKGREILAKEVVEEIFTPAMVVKPSFSETAPINENSGFCYTLGWGRYNYLGKVVIEKGGALDGVRSIITLIPELKLGIVVLANLNLTLLPEKIRAHFLELYIGKDPSQDLEKSFADSEAAIAKLIEPPQVPKGALPMPMPISSYEGVYSNDLYGEFRIVKNGKELAVEAGDSGYRGALVHQGNNSFLLRWPRVNSAGELVTFVFGADGKIIEMQTESLGVFKASKLS